MKKIGLIGGISWTSTVDYYRYLNEETNKRLGSLNSAECLIYSVNFEHYRNYNAAYNWDRVFELLSQAALHLKDAGAEVIMLGANTAHIVAERIAQEIGLPLIDIRVATANAIIEKNITTVALLGTTYTMELDFYKDKLLASGIKTIIPNNQSDRDFIEETLLYELGRGIIKETTRDEYLKIANTLIKNGAEAIILGCTEIPLLISQDHFTVPVFNTTQIHAIAAVDFALKNE